MMTSSTTVAKNTSRKSSEYGSIPMENGNSSQLNLAEPLQDEGVNWWFDGRKWDFNLQINQHPGIS